MSVTNIMGRLDMAEKLTIPQLRVAIQNGSLPAYIGIPLLQNKIQMRKRLDQAKNIREQATTPVAQQVMQESAQYGGIDGLPSGLPLQAPQGMAEGGIIALQAGGSTGEQTRRVNPRTNLPYTDAEMASGLPYEDARNSVINNTKGVWDTVVDTASEYGNRALDTVSEFGNTAWDTIKGLHNEYGASGLLRRFTADTPPPKVAPPQPSASVEPKTDTKTPPAVNDKKKNGVEDKKQTAPPSGAGIAALSGSQAAVAPETPADVERERPRSALDQYVDMLMKEREGAAASREEAKNMALIQAGLAIMAGKSPNALTNIGEGAQRGLATYAGLQKEVDEAEANRLKQLVSIAGVKEQLARDDRKLGLTEQQLAQQMEIAQLQANTRLAAAARRGSGGAGVGGKPMTQAQIMTAVQNIANSLKDDPNYIGKSRQEIEQAAMNIFMQRSAFMSGVPMPQNQEPEGVDFMEFLGGGDE